MYLVWAGVLLVACKYFEFGPMAEWSWWWILAPFGLAFIWFEALERVFGRDRRKVDHVRHEALRKQRVAEQFAQVGGRPAKKR